MTAAIVLYAAVASLVIFALCVGYAVGLVEGLTDRWLWAHAVRPLGRWLWAALPRSADEVALDVLLVPLVFVSAMLDPEGFRSAMRNLPRRDAAR